MFRVCVNNETDGCSAKYKMRVYITTVSVGTSTLVQHKLRMPQHSKKSCYVRYTGLTNL